MIFNYSPSPANSCHPLDVADDDDGRKETPAATTFFVSCTPYVSDKETSTRQANCTTVTCSLFRYYILSAGSTHGKDTAPLTKDTPTMAFSHNVARQREKIA